MRVTPKISDSPAATKNSDDAPARPLSSWTSRLEKVMDQCVPFAGRVTGSGQALRQTQGERRVAVQAESVKAFRDKIAACA